MRTATGTLILKCNGLDDEPMVMALYRAAQSGVSIDLIVRGICSLRPGLAGLSETVHVRSIVGRFLEHDRIYYFRNGGKEEVMISSGDLMSGNLHKRIETVTPIEDAALLRELRDVVLEAYLRDNTHARVLHSDGSYVRLSPGDGSAYDAQAELLAGALTTSRAVPIADVPTQTDAEAPNHGLHNSLQSTARSYSTRNAT